MEQAWTGMLAAQGQGKDMKKWIEHWKPALELDIEKKNDMDAFLAQVGNGF